MLSLLAILNVLVFTPDTVPTEVGTYPVVVEYSDETQTKSKVIQFTVISTDTIIEEKIAIDAHDFKIGEDASVTEEIIIQNSEAKAWNTTTGEDYVIDRMEIMKVDDTLYEVVLYSFQGINTKINIYVDQSYNENIVLKDDRSSAIGDGDIFDAYNMQYLEIIVINILLIIIVLFFVRRYNKLLDKLVRGLKEAKRTSKKS